MKRKDTKWRVRAPYLFLVPLVILSCSAAVKGVTQNDMCSCAEADSFNIILIKNIPESLPEGSVISKLNFSGGTSIILSVVLKSSNILFDNITREFKIKQQFNITNKTPLLVDGIVINCIIVSTNQSIHYQVFMEVHDENNNPPMFLNTPIELNTSEATPVGSNIYPEIVAVDADPSDAGKLTYSLKRTNEYSDYFNFTTPSNGRLTLQKELNYDLVQQLLLEVEVKDNSYNTTILGRLQPQHVTSTKVKINVVSVFEDIFQYVKSSYLLNVSDNDERVPIDASFQSTNDLELSLVQDQDNGDWKNFKVTGTGILEIVGKLTKSQYILQFKVKKVGKSIFATSLISINVLRPIKFLHRSSNLDLMENTPTGTFVTRLELTYYRDPVRYYFVGNSSETSYFKLNDSSGILTTSNSLDGIGKNLFNITVGMIASPYGQSDATVVQVQIIRIFSSIPRFSNKIYEFQYSNKQIGEVQATDPTSQFSITYKLIDAHGTFSIDTNGRISCGECNSINEPIIPIVVIAEATTPYNRSDYALVVLHKNVNYDASKVDSQPNYVAAFVASIVLACIFFILLVILAAFVCYLSRRGVDNYVDPQNRPNPPENSSAPYEELRGSTLKSVQSALSSSKLGKVGKKKPQPTEVKTVSSEVPLAETSDVKMLVHKESIASNTTVEKLRQQTMSDTIMKKPDRLDWTSSQETINASNMTLTRPAVGTNGITLYY